MSMSGNVLMLIVASQTSIMRGADRGEAYSRRRPLIVLIARPTD